MPFMHAACAGRAHCVGGSDYGHVRVGAFMGLRAASQLAAEAAGAGGSDGDVAPLGAAGSS